MADFCKQCSIEMFNEDFKELEGLCKEGDAIRVLCEGCGPPDGVLVDYKGRCIDIKCPNRGKHKAFEKPEQTPHARLNPLRQREMIREKDHE